MYISFFTAAVEVENLEELLREKDGQVDVARSRLTAVQAHHSSSEGTLTSLEEAVGDRDRQISQLREQRDRLEKERAQHGTCLWGILCLTLTWGAERRSHVLARRARRI